MSQEEKVLWALLTQEEKKSLIDQGYVTPEGTILSGNLDLVPANREVRDGHE